MVQISAEGVEKLKQFAGIRGEVDTETLVAAVVEAAREQWPNGRSAAGVEAAGGSAPSAASTPAAATEGAEPLEVAKLRWQRDTLIDAAIADGRTVEGRRSHWEQEFEGDPVSAANLLAVLGRGVVPAADEPDDETSGGVYEDLYPPMQEKPVTGALTAGTFFAYRG